MCKDICLDMCIDMRADMQTELCVDICVRKFIEHAYAAHMYVHMSIHTSKKNLSSTFRSGDMFLFVFTDTHVDMLSVRGRTQACLRTCA